MLIKIDIPIQLFGLMVRVIIYKYHLLDLILKILVRVIGLLNFGFIDIIIHNKLSMTRELLQHKTVH